MSSSKLDTSGVFHPTHSQAQQTRLILSDHAVRIRKNGIEFHTGNPIAQWTEMSVDLESPREGKKVRCRGVVVACTGNRHTGYVVSMLFINLSRQSQARLSSLAFSQLS